MNAVMRMTKECTRCHRRLSLDKFSPRNDRPGSYQSHCGQCKVEARAIREAGRVKAKAEPVDPWARPLPEVECDLALVVFMRATAEPVRASL